MPARVTVRRLELRCLAPGDHPAPGELQGRLSDAARRFLPEALDDALHAWSGDAVLRIKRIEVDITQQASFEPRDFASLLARALAQKLRRVDEGGSLDGSDGVIRYASRVIFVAALLEALVQGRAFERWWLRDTDSLRFLSTAQAIRTVALAEPRTGLEAIASLAPITRMQVLRMLTPPEMERTLSGFARSGTAADFEACAEAVAEAVAELPEGASALAAFVGAFARRPVLMGETLAAAARLWSEIKQGQRDGTLVLAELPSEKQAQAGISTRHPTARRILEVAQAARSRDSAGPGVPYRFTPFGGLLLLLPEIGFSNLASVASTIRDAPHEAAALIGYAALGLCAGRDRFIEYLADALWRELFGIDSRISASIVLERLSGVSDDAWAAFLPLTAPLDTRRDGRFLLPPPALVASRSARRALAGLARAASRRFARRLAGFGDASAPFLWTNLLATTAALERRPDGWSARLSRPPLDVLLSLARIAEGCVHAPLGARIDLARIAP